MNSVLVVVFSSLVFLFGISVYANKLEKLFELRSSEKTPAYTRYDGIDYVPAKNWLILFGHHFSSIAGAAPIVGPIIAVSIWGWFPVAVWIVLGSVFIGGLHDFSALCISVKKDGETIGQIAKDVISYKARSVFSFFILLTLLLVISVFVYLCAKTFVTDPHIVIPSLGLIPVALICGIFIYKLKKNQFKVTIFGLLLLFLLILAGRIVSVCERLEVWIILLLVYAFFASTAPVHLLLQPRDYLSAYLLFFGIATGYTGIFLSHPEIHIPSFIKTEYPLWPFLFVTVACGAVSGFHSLIATGTTSKQLANQMDAKKIGYGAMILEGALALLSLLCIASGIKDYRMLKEVISKGGPILVFSKGFGAVTSPILRGFGETIAVVILNTFILTTLDTATRISRHVFSELTGIKNRFITTAFILGLAGILSFSGKWRLIWPAFGASNQLLAVFTFFVVTGWLFSKKKKIKLILSLTTFVFLTTFSSLFLQILTYIKKTQYILFSISAILLILSLFLLVESLRKIIKKWVLQKGADL